jgi:hypothetical protein
MHMSRPPLVPVRVLKAHRVYEPTDSRFRAEARLLQALWREDKGLPVGYHRNARGKRHRLGSRLDTKSAERGANFLSPDIARLALRESVYREIGAMMEQERLWTNLLSSQPLCFNLFGGMKLDIDKANRFFQHLFRGYLASVEDIYFEHSPGRGNPAFTNDHTAFDVFVICTTVDEQHGFVAIEVKYTETMTEPLTIVRPRYDELSRASCIYKDPDALALRGSPLQQLWREHLLSRSMIGTEPYSTGRFVVIYPKQNGQCDMALNAYRLHLVADAPSISGFQAVTLEDCIETLRAIGDNESASALYGRYLDFERVARAIFV